MLEIVGICSVNTEALCVSPDSEVELSRDCFAVFAHVVARGLLRCRGRTATGGRHCAWDKLPRRSVQWVKGTTWWSIMASSMRFHESIIILILIILWILWIYCFFLKTVSWPASTEKAWWRASGATLGLQLIDLTQSILEFWYPAPPTSCPLNPKSLEGIWRRDLDTSRSQGPLLQHVCCVAGWHCSQE